MKQEFAKKNDEGEAKFLDEGSANLLDQIKVMKKKESEDVVEDLDEQI